MCKNTAVLTIERYRKLNGLILRNNTTVTPISPLHQYLQEQQKKASKEDKNSWKLLQQILRGMFLCPSNNIATSTKFLEEILSEPDFQNLCVSGTATFLLHNSINHSCEPNVVALSNSISCEVNVVCYRKQIHKDQELFLSYIDESLPTQERQKILRDRYLFQCKCVKCSKKI